MKTNRINSRRLELGLALAIAAIGGTQSAQAADPMTSATGGNVASADRTFIEKATIGGMTEVKASTLAEQHGSTQAVKDFAAKMVADHTKAGADLQTIAASKNVTVPGTLDASHEKAVDKLAKLSGTDFDKAYMKQMVSDHKSTVSLFKKEEKSKDANLQAFAEKTRPTIEGHLKMAQDITSMK